MLLRVLYFDQLPGWAYVVIGVVVSYCVVLCVASLVSLYVRESFIYSRLEVVCGTQPLTTKVYSYSS